MRVAVPASVLDWLEATLDGLNLSPTKRRNYKMRFYYILSRIVIHNDNIELYAKNDFYRHVSSRIMKNIIDDYDYLMGLLKNPVNPIIESNGSYSNFENNKYTLAYRLTENYATGEVVFKQLSRKFVKRIEKNLKEDPEQEIMNNKYSFALNQYSKNPLSISPLVYDYIMNFGKALLSKVENGNVYQKQLIFSKIGRWLYFVEKIENGELNPMVSAKNHRLNSRFTSINKMLRSFITCNSHSLISVDVSASQPYVLTSVINTSFYSLSTNEYSIYNIYNSLHYKLINNSIYYKQCINSKYSSVVYPFMWGEFFNYFELENLKEYQNIQFEQDFYSYAIRLDNPSISENELVEARSKFKKSMMCILFADEGDKRSKLKMLGMFKKVLPGINAWIEKAHKVFGKKDFSLIMQRAESFILIHKAARCFHENYPEAPIFSIHDGLYTDEGHIAALKAIVEEVCKSIIGIKPGLKVEFPNLNIEPRFEDIEKVWSKIRPTNTKAKLKKKSRSVFSSNVKRGMHFLEKVIT